MKRLFWPAILVAALLFAIKLDRHRRNVDRVVIVTIDRVRADHLPFQGYPRATTAFLSELVSEGYVFDGALSSSPDLPLALRSLSTSRHAFEAAAPNVPSLLDRLRARGFDTATFSDDPEFVGAVTGTAFSSYPSAQEAALEAAKWFRSKKRKKKIAVWLHLSGAAEAANPSRVDQLSPIGPEVSRYLVATQGLPAGPDGRATEASLARVRFHDARIHVVDRAIGRFHGYTLNRKRPTMMIVTGCRGESFDEADDGQRLDQGMVRVPLLVWFSDDRGPGKRFPGLVRHIDIWPSIADVTLPIHQRIDFHAQGRSFSSALRKKGNWAGTTSAFLERAAGSLALVSGPRKLVKIGETFRLYDLRSDPLERADLSAAQPRTFGRMRRRLERLARG